ncbi:MAG: PQQ-dependent sugar dehydrogenase, partial [Actinomycetota bacterium]|nr:PQQ-dependent sugar dehydrogenase [Actinomycetota bacterium]
GAVVLQGCGATTAAGGGDAPPVATAEPSAAPQPSAPTEPRAAPAPRSLAAERPPLRTASSRPRITTIARNLRVPWDIAFLPDRRALVTERGGAVRIVSRARRLRGAPLARIPVRAAGEGGLLGVAVDPDFARGRRFVYFYVTRGSIRIERYRFAGNRLRRDGTVLTGIRGGSIHDSGRLRFGPDRRLYITTGDAGSGALAQQDGLNGKVLRLAPAQYRGSTGSPERYAKGLRNPQGLDWQPGSNRLWVTDHGPSGFDGPSGKDELNVVRRGANYGWPVRRGRDHGAFAAPARVWGRTIAPSGLTFVSRDGSSWTGDVLVAALKGRSLRRLAVSGARVTGERTLLQGRYGRLRAVVEAPDGTIWVTTSNNGDQYGSPVSRDDDRILRIIPPRG